MLNFYQFLSFLLIIVNLEKFEKKSKGRNNLFTIFNKTEYLLNLK